MFRTLCAFALATSVAGSAVAQTVWIVDTDNRPGTNFTTIQEAVDAAAAGDVLLVRNGSYQPFVVDKSLSVVGPTNGLALVVGSTPPVTVRDLPDGSDVAIRNITVGSVGAFAVDLVDNRGRVLLDEIGAFLAIAPIQVVDCDQVVINRSDLIGDLTVTRSTVMMSGGSLLGEGGASTGPGGSGLVAIDSDIHLANVSVRGGGSFTGGSGGPGISMSNSTITVAGDGSANIEGGQTVFGSLPASAVVGDGTIILDPDVQLLPFGGAPAVAGSVSIVSQEMSFVTATGGDLGQMSQVDVHGQEGDSYFLLVGRPGNAIALPGLGELWLDPTALGLVSSGEIDATGVASFSFQVPNVFGVLGVQVHWAGITVGASVQLTNMAGYTFGRA